MTDNKKEIGLKFDNGKPMVGTMLSVFPNAFMAIGAVIKKGQEKYPNPNNWKLVDNKTQRYTDALIRHLIKYLTGTEYDNESGHHHLAHVAWNALAILETALTQPENKEYNDKNFE